MVGIVLQFVLPILVVVGLYLAIYIRLSDRPPVSLIGLSSGGRAKLVIS